MVDLTSHGCHKLKRASISGVSIYSEESYRCILYDMKRFDDVCFILKLCEEM